VARCLAITRQIRKLCRRYKAPGGKRPKRLFNLRMPFAGILNMRVLEGVMRKAIIVGLVGLGFLASTSYASELKIGSWGGNVRSGPSADYPKIGSLTNGDPVVLLKKVKSAGSEFNWFKIAYGNGEVGYQWGGILCGFNNEVTGTFGLCNKDNRSTPRIYKCSEQSQLRSLGSKRKTKITFFAGQTHDKFKIYWIDYNSNKTFYSDLSSGMSWTAETYPSHPWAVYRVSASGSETCHSVVRGRKDPSHWLLR
jgi:hypothetical protein